MSWIEDEDVSVETAERVLRKRYWDAVRSHAKDVLQAVKDGQDEDEALHETADGSSWVIYTRQALEVLRFSESDSEIDEIPDVQSIIRERGITGLYSVLAFYAFEADIRRQMEALKEDQTDEDEETEGEA